MNTHKGFVPFFWIIVLILGMGYAVIIQKGKFDAAKESTSLGINVSGIDPLSLSMAPVPSLNNEYNGVSTTSPATDKDGTIFHFRSYHFDFDLLSKTLGCNSGAYQDLDVLGYTLMGGIPTAVTLVNERVCGTGYFPHIVLYQAKGECREALVGCYRDTKITDIIGLGGDRINIGFLSIKPNHISLTYLSVGKKESTTVNLEYVGGKLVKK